MDVDDFFIRSNSFRNRGLLWFAGGNRVQKKKARDERALGKIRGMWVIGGADGRVFLPADGSRSAV
ncbi:hypothetical protein AAGU71_11445 [Edwardsiella ictaluri]